MGPRARARLQVLAPGLAMATAVALVSAGIGAVESRALGQALLEPIVVALLLGVVLRAVIGQKASLKPGADFAAKPLLEASVVLIGASVDIRQILASGLVLPLIVILAVTASLGVSFVIGRRLGLSRNLAILVAVGNSICGNSAIAAVAPIIKAEKRDVASAIALTAVLGVTLVLALPIAIVVLGLSDYQYGVLAGMSVYSVPQVVAAAFRISDLAGNVATLVKLMRVAMLGPTVLVIGLLVGGQDASGGRVRPWRYVPWFVTGFLILAVARSVGLIPVAIAVDAGDIGKWLTVVAMAGLGYGVDLAQVRTVGVRVGAAVILSLAFMITFTLVAIAVTAIR